MTHLPVQNQLLGFFTMYLMVVTAGLAVTGLAVARLQKAGLAVTGLEVSRKVLAWPGVAELAGLMTWSGGWPRLVVQAQELDSVWVSELMPAPASGSKEWVELHNAGAEAVLLAGWYLEDVVSQPSVIYTFETGVEIAAGEYLVIELDSRLNNSGDGVTLYDDSHQVQDAMSYDHSTSAQSWALIGGAWTLTELTTPGAPNPVPSPSPSAAPSASPSPVASPSGSPQVTPSPSATASPYPSPSPSSTPGLIDTSYLELTEIMACPASGQNEWLELHNTGAAALPLTDWKVVDNAGNSRVFSATLAPGEYRAIEWTGSLLNNTGDTLLVLTPQGQIWYSTELASCVTGQSWVASSQGWLASSSPTPSDPNPSVSPTPSPASSVASATASSSLATQSGTVGAAALKVSAAATPGAASPYPGQLPLLDLAPRLTLSPTLAEPLPSSASIDLSAPNPSQAGFAGLVGGGSLLSLLGGWGTRRLWQKIKPELSNAEGFPVQ